MRRKITPIAASGRRQRAEIVIHRIELAAEQHGAELTALEACVRLFTEGIAAVELRTFVQVQAVLELEYSLKAPAQVFRAFESEDGVFGCRTRFLPGAVAALVVRVDKAGIDYAIQRHTALCMR
jgi:hypothetical protein